MLASPASLDRTDRGAAIKGAPFFSTAITSACRVTSQKGRIPGCSTQYTGASARSSVNAACSLSSSVWPSGDITNSAALRSRAVRTGTGGDRRAPARGTVDLLNSSPTTFRVIGHPRRRHRRLSRPRSASRLIRLWSASQECKFLQSVIAQDLDRPAKFLLAESSPFFHLGAVELP
jgi:hypothetical protein